MLYVTGDLHIPIDIEKLNGKRFPEQKQLTKRDFVVVCGDFGGIWSGGRKDRYWLRWLERKRFTTLFVDGNHENFDLLDAFPVQRWSGGKVHKVAEGVYHLMRGQVYSVEGRKLFAMGGGASGDREFRTEGVSWWPPGSAQGKPNSPCRPFWSRRRGGCNSPTGISGICTGMRRWTSGLPRYTSGCCGFGDSRRICMVLYKRALPVYNRQGPFI